MRLGQHDGVGSDMERFLTSVERSIQTENWYSALTMSLALPDICGWLEDPALRSQRRYESWFDTYLGPTYRIQLNGRDVTFLTASDCYALRCAYLHEGADEVLRQKARDVVSRFVFCATGSHRVLVNTVLLLDARTFCGEVCAGVRQWSLNVAANPEVQGRMAELLLVRTGAFSI